MAGYARRPACIRTKAGSTASGSKSPTWTAPFSIVATCAHELAHVVLLGQGRISLDAEDHEQLADLLPVFFGLGVFSANAVIRERNWVARSGAGAV